MNIQLRLLALNEIAKDFERKYKDFVPEFLALADCQEKIQFSLDSAYEKLAKLKNGVDVAESDLSQLTVCAFCDSFHSYIPFLGRRPHQKAQRCKRSHRAPRRTQQARGGVELVMAWSEQWRKPELP